MPAPEDLQPHYARRLRDVLENSSEGYLLADTQGVVLDLNSCAAAHFGVPREQLLGTRPLDLLSPGQSAPLAATSRRALATGEPQVYEGPSLLMPGRWIVIRAFRVPEGLALHFRDITEQHATEQALRRSEAELKNFFELAAAGNAEIDLATGRYHRVNRRFCELTGYDAEELLRLSPEDITHPDDWGLECALGRRLLEGEIPSFQLEKRIVRNDGATLWAQVSAALSRDEQGRPLRFLRVLQDVTVRRHAEEALRDSEKRLRAVLDVLPIAVLIADAGGRILAVNPAAGALWGGAPHSEDPDRFARDYRAWWPDSGRPVAAEEWGLARAVRKGEVVLGEEMEIEAAGGERRTILNYALPIRDENGRIDGAVAAHVDITVRKEIEHELRRLTDELERRVAERTAVAELRARQLSGLSLQLTQVEEQERHRLARILHDGLQQLLVGAKLGLDILRSRATDRPDLQAQARQVEDLLQECIESSRSLSYELSPPVLHEGDLSEALRWLARHVRQKYGMNVQLRLAGEPPGLPLPARVLLFQAARELLFNARKHGRTDRAEVELAVAGPEVRLAVADGGAGFDPAVLDGPHDTGYGLFGIRERVAVVGGRLEIRSAPGQGSRFTVAVPLASPQAPPPERRRAAHPAGPAAVRPQPDLVPEPEARREGRSRIRVLLADDHRIMRQGLELLLREEPDLEVVGGAGDGREAVELAGRLHPDVVLMDVTMPEMDGVEATRRIRAEHPDIRIIGLSMHEESDMGGRMRDAGAAAYLHKAGPPQWLLGAIRAG